MKCIACGAAVLLVLVLIDTAAAVQFTLLHGFSGGPGDGKWGAGLTLVDSTLYGATSNGGSANDGTLFRLATDGGGYQVLHNFSASLSDGNAPTGPVAISGSKLYGTTALGGVNNGGTIYEINTDGTGFQLIESMARTLGNAASPNPIVLDGSTLYGTTLRGGSHNAGSVYSINTDSTGSQVLHSFNGLDGGSPEAGVLISGSVLYGTTNGGNNHAEVFRVNSDGTGFQVLHNFAPRDGNTLGKPLALVGSTLYGTTAFGGSLQGGIVFSVNTDGTGFQQLHAFDALSGHSPNSPFGGITIVGTTLYGSTFYGGSSGDGTLYRMNIDGTGFEVLYNFSGGDGQGPGTNLIVVGSTIYGSTQLGGPNNLGEVFAITVPEPNATVLAAIGLAAFLWLAQVRCARAKMALSDAHPA